MVIKIRNNLVNNQEIIKSFLEKIYFLSPNIVSCKIKKTIIEVKIEKNFTKVKKLKTDILKLSQRINLSSRIKKDEIYFINNIFLKKQSKNIYDELVKTNQIKKISEGVYTYQGKFLEKMKKLDKLLYELGKKQKYIEISVNETLPLKSLVDNQYLNNFPNHPLFVSNVRRDIDILDKISNEKKIDQFYLSDKLEEPNMVLSPTVCYHCFELNKNKFLSKNITYNVVSKCNRYESKNYRTLERLQSFTMREYVAYGSKNYVNTFLKNNLEKFIKLFKKLKIKFRIISASDPFFSQDGIKKLIFQGSQNLKYEVQFFLPNENKWLAVGSFNNHLTALTNKYNIKKNSNFLYSGCIGFGFERFIYSIICQNIKF